jgi:2-iminobutanoate/2-iminopropanoate deaminase
MCWDSRERCVGCDDGLTLHLRVFAPLRERGCFWFTRRREDAKAQAVIRAVCASDGAAASGDYAQAVHLTGVEELVLVSGQIPVDEDGAVPDTFADQCRLVWRNVEAQLGAAGMGLSDIVKVTTYLSDRAYAAENSAIRQELLAGLTPALTIIIAGIYDPAWLLEIEVIAAR